MRILQNDNNGQNQAILVLYIKLSRDHSDHETVQKTIYLSLLQSLVSNN